MADFFHYGGGNDFWNHLADNLDKRYLYGKKDCPECRGMGIVLDPQGAGWSEPAFLVCSCVENITLCNKQPPFEYFDESSGNMLPCPSRPARLALERLRIIRQMSAVPPRFAWKFLNSADQTTTGDFMIALDMATELIREYGKKESKGPVRGLYLYGDPGTGKTLLSCIILNEIMRLYQTPVLYAKISRDILSRLRATFNPGSASYGEGDRIEKSLAKVPVLVIDDFGVQKESEWGNSVLYDLIDSRYENNLTTIITSNEPPESWKEVNRGRVYSRITEMCRIIQIQEEDYRVRAKS